MKWPTIYQIVKVNLKFLFYIKMNNLSYIYENDNYISTLYIYSLLWNHCLLGVLHSMVHWA